MPGMPGTKAVGTNTATSTRPIAISAPDTSSIVRCAASLGLIPPRQFFYNASTQTNRLLTTFPHASDYTNRDHVFVRKPTPSHTPTHTTIYPETVITG